MSTRPTYWHQDHAHQLIDARDAVWDLLGECRDGGASYVLSRIAMHINAELDAMFE